MKRRRRKYFGRDVYGWCWFWDRGKKEKVNMEVTGMHEKRSLYVEALKDCYCSLVISRAQRVAGHGVEQ